MKALITFVLVTLFATSAFAQDESKTSGWFRMDHDALGLQLWAGASYDLDGPVDISSNIYLFPQATFCDDTGACSTSTYGEWDLGVSITAGNFLFIPMAGVGMDWELGKPVSIVVPQLYAYFDTDEVHVEWWSNIAFNSWLDDAAGDVWYNRLFVLYNALPELSVGPQAEASYVLKDTVDYLPVGGRLNLEFGENNTVGVFGGYDFKTQLDGKVAGRITFVRYF